MKVKTIFSLLTISFIYLFAFYSCTKDEDECDTSYIGNYIDVNSMSNAVKKLKKWSTTGVEVSPSPYKDSIAFDSLLIEMGFTGPYIAHETRGGRFSLFNCAFATCGHPPANGYMGCKESVKSIKVISANDFDSAHLAGSQLNDLFTIYAYYNSTDSASNSPLSLFTNTFPRQNPLWFDLRLTSKPALSKNQKFNITVIMTNEEAYVRDLIPLKLF